MARLPQPGSDQGTWGTILNQYLLIAHNSSGTIKNSSIAETMLASAVRTKLNSKSGVTSLNTRTGAVVLTKTDVGLSSVSNTSDANKPVSIATQTALNLKANSSTLTSHANDTANPHAVTKAQVGLSNVDNTSDADKPVSAATLLALGVKASLDSPTFTGAVTVPTPVNNTDAATKNYVDTIASVGTPDANATTKGKIQLAGDLAGTADAPTVPGLAQKADIEALNAKASLDSPVFIGTVTVPTPVYNTDAATKNYVDTTAFFGTPDATTTAKGKLQLAGDLAGTADAPTVPGLVDKADVATVNLKAPLESPTFSGSVTVPTPVDTTDAATKAYVDSMASVGTPDANATTKGKLQLAGDLAGTAAAPTVPGLALKANTTALTTHTTNVSNPHVVTKAQVGLGNVNNIGFLILGPSDPVPTGTPMGTVIIRST